MPTDTSLDASTDPDADGDVDTGDTDSDVTSGFGYFYPPVSIMRHELSGGHVHTMRYATDHQHIGTVITRSEQAHTAVQWNGRLSEHNTVQGAITHLALAHGIRNDLPVESV